VSVARALVTSPRVLLLDEPFAALDDLLRGQLGELLLELWARRRFTAVMVTHNIGEAILLSDQVIVMRSGKTQAPLTNPLPKPRSDSLRRTAEFGAFYGVISDCMRAES
jgi:NitT/TauT family transport system ATP-binding protein